MASQSSVHDSSDEDHSVLVEPEREIKCPVHGYISVSRLITSIIDTPQFQRLRYLKQLGTSYFVWPGASHNRFEHSLGVFHLSKMMVMRLRNAQPHLNITDRDVRCVEVAGLCHDLGHGPFSHVWDNEFIPRALPGIKWAHEDASEMMLDYLVDDNDIQLTPDEVRFIKDLIAGKKKHTIKHSPPEKDYLFEIVANKRNGIDVDKFDYIARDKHAVSSGTVTDLLRLVNSARVIDGEICYSEKNMATVYGLFQERFNLHKTIYHHKTAKSIELMIVDALLKADPYLKLAERINDPKRFMHLDDSILLEVERSECPELAESRQIMRRVRKRDLYRLVDKAFISWDDRHLWSHDFTPESIVEAAKNLKVPDVDGTDVQQRISELTVEHVIVEMSELHHGMGDKFPLDNCKFYGKYSPDKAHSPKREDISHLLPSGFGEVWNRVFTRDSRFYGVIQAAARALIVTIEPDRLPPSVQPHTPEAPRTPRATSSMSSIISDAYTERGTASETVPKTPRAGYSGSAGSHPTPFRNNCLTVPVNFSPSVIESSQGSGRKRKEASEDEVEGPGSTTASGSPKRRRKKNA
ncbi:hypothetical protein JB92DRAFT_3087920 [Gautieria morchelliformis]|nr:hypothetical protein JB92DRAFT_3087920 [Gautieria morchelliformis]